jgi:hypothetical protein
VVFCSTTGYSDPYRVILLSLVISSKSQLVLEQFPIPKEQIARHRLGDLTSLGKIDLLVFSIAADFTSNEPREAKREIDLETPTK